MQPHEEFKDRRLKYVELPRVFEHAANEIDISAKIQIRTCEALAKQIKNSKPKNATEFEKIESLKNFVIKSSELSEKMIDLLAYLKNVLQEIAEDAKGLAANAREFDRLRDQSETIQMLIQQRETIVKAFYDNRKGNITGNTGYTQLPG